MTVLLFRLEQTNGPTTTIVPPAPTETPEWPARHSRYAAADSH